MHTSKVSGHGSIVNGLSTEIRLWAFIAVQRVDVLSISACLQTKVSGWLTGSQYAPLPGRRRVAVGGRRVPRHLCSATDVAITQVQHGPTAELD
jgi:hypothetical protein